MVALAVPLDPAYVCVAAESPLARAVKGGVPVAGATAAKDGRRRRCADTIRIDVVHPDAEGPERYCRDEDCDGQDRPLEPPPFGTFPGVVLQAAGRRGKLGVGPHVLFQLLFEWTVIPHQLLYGTLHECVDFSRVVTAFADRRLRESHTANLGGCQSA